MKNKKFLHAKYKPKYVVMKEYGDYYINKVSHRTKDVSYVYDDGYFKFFRLEKARIYIETNIIDYSPEAKRHDIKGLFMNKDEALDFLHMLHVKRLIFRFMIFILFVAFLVDYLFFI